LLGHTWSLAVEEQFYLLWPALFVLLMHRRFSRGCMALSLALIAVAEMVYRVAAASAGYSSYRIYYGTDTHSDGLLIGCAIAFWLASHRSAWVYQTASGLVKCATGLAMAVLVIRRCVLSGGFGRNRSGLGPPMRRSRVSPANAMEKRCSRDG